MRENILLDKNWLFHKGELEYKVPTTKGPIYSSAKTEMMKWGPACVEYNDEPDDYRFGVEYNTTRWDSVDLPHDYIIGGEVSGDRNGATGFFEYCPAWYRKHLVFTNEDSDKRITLLFEGVASVATVYFNGSLMKTNICGYNSFEINISDYIRIGEDNVIAVYVTQTGHEGWWYEGGGIYRHVRLIKTEKAAIDLWGVYIAPQRNDDGSFTLGIETTVINDDYEDKKLTVETTICNPEGAKVASVSSDIAVAARDKAVASYETKLDNPVLWDIDNPYQYTAVTRLCEKEQGIDEYKTRFGCRYYRIDPDKGFFLNGRSVKIKGICSHQDFGLTGKAVPDNIYRYRIELIKEMGANGYRTSHYPHSEATMDALDDLGFIVLDETRWFESTEEGIKQLEMVLKRDRNRPSVFMWSLGNEEPCHLTETGRRINRAMMAHAKKFDKFRPMTSAISHDPDVATICADMDVIGVNYNHTKLDKVHALYPDKPVFSSECCATGTTRAIYTEPDPTRAYLPAYDRITNNSFISREIMWRLVTEREWLFGAYQWIAFEHRGEATWPRLCSQSGAIDLFLQKKDAFYQNKSHWSEEPMLHLLPHWNFKGLEGEMIKVFVYTNCEETELFVNGVSAGRQKINKPSHGEWHVKYELGEIRAVGYIGGAEVCSECRRTTGASYALGLRLMNRFEANGRDMALYTCFVTDKDGMEVPDAEPFVNFSSSENAKLVGTGSDISDHTPVTLSSRRMRAGLITVALLPEKGTKEIRLYARAEGLVTGFIRTECKNDNE